MSFAQDPAKDPRYRAIRRAVERCGFECVRADVIEHSGQITQVVTDRIRSSPLVVADLTGERPNCYYEVGLAHALGRSVILTSSKRSRRHFDVEGYNFILYRSHGDLESRLVRRIRGLFPQRGRRRGPPPAGLLPDERRRPVVERLLAAAVLAMAYPRSLEEVNLRAWCHLADRRRKVLVPFASSVQHYTVDRLVEVPCTGRSSRPFVIAEAFNSKAVRVKPITAAQKRAYTAGFRDRIPEELLWVLAAPIRAFERPDEEVLGTVSIDCLRGGEAPRLSARAAGDLVESLAAVLYRLLRGGEAEAAGG
jgi:hypothetical protein